MRDRFIQHNARPTNPYAAPVHACATRDNLGSGGEPERMKTGTGVTPPTQATYTRARPIGQIVQAADFFHKPRELLKMIVLFRVTMD